MSVTAEQMLSWCQQFIGPTRSKGPLAQYLAAIGRLSSLADVASGTVVLVRGDVDAKPGPKIGDGDIRLRSIVETLNFGRQRGWKQVVFGHRGRKPEESLAAVAKRLGELLGCDVPLVADWLDAGTLTIRDRVSQLIGNSAPGSVLLLENTRRYDIERVLWTATADALPTLAEPLARIANEFVAKLGRVYVNEALSAGSLDTSTIVLPAAMDRVALGAYVAREFDGPMSRCLEAKVVIFSGLKIDKLDDLQAMIGRGTIRMVIAGGSLAMALKKAEAKLAGKDFCLGLAEDPAHADKPYYIPPERVEQAKQILAQARGKGIQFVLPIDFVLADGRTSDTIGPTEQQFDVGPKTSELLAAKVTEFLQSPRDRPAVVFHNGVLGMFEDPRFEEGTRRFIAQLKRMKDAAAEVYVGGGEGGAALEKYGHADDVTHCFTAGGTVLNALGSEPVPYLVALAAAAMRKH